MKHLSLVIHIDGVLENAMLILRWPGKWSEMIPRREFPSHVWWSILVFVRNQCSEAAITAYIRLQNGLNPERSTRNSWRVSERLGGLYEGYAWLCTNRWCLMYVDVGDQPSHRLLLVNANRLTFMWQTHGFPREIIEPWETWLPRSMVTSRGGCRGFSLGVSWHGGTPSHPFRTMGCSRMFHQKTIHVGDRPWSKMHIYGGFLK